MYIRKEKKEKYCKYCNKKFYTARENQKFCSVEHKEKQHYKDRTMYQTTRAKAIQKLHDKNKSRTSGVLYLPKEVQQILKMYKKGASAVAIAQKLDRPVQGVRWKIRKLKEELAIVDEGIL